MHYYKYTPMRAQVLTLQYMKNFYVTQNYVTNVVITDRINAVGNATILSFGSEFARDMGNVRLVIWAVWGNFPLNWGSAIKTENTRDTQRKLRRQAGCFNESSTIFLDGRQREKRPMSDIGSLGQFPLNGEVM